MQNKLLAWMVVILVLAGLTVSCSVASPSTTTLTTASDGTVSGLELVSFHAIVTGLVQGVGYRDYAVQMGSLYKVTGWVQNLPNGSVEVQAEGERSRLEGFIYKLKIGPSRATVRYVEVTWGEYLGEYLSFTRLN